MRWAAQQEQDAGWAACWKLAVRPSADIAVAMPVDCLRFVRDPRAFDMLWREPFRASDGDCRVHWMAWAPDAGLVVAVEDWRPAKGLPIPPEDGWIPASEWWGKRMATLSLPRRSRPVEPRYVSMDGLPYPLSVASSRTLTRERATVLAQGLWSGFVGQMPADVRHAFEIIGNAAGPDRMFPLDRSSIPWPRLNRLLGAEGTDMVGAPEKSTRRSQFVASYPLLATTPLFSDPDVVACIDHARELGPVLARSLGTRERVVRALARIPEETRAAAASFLYHPFCLNLLDGMDPSRLPALAGLSGAGWGALATLLDTLVPGSRHDPERVFGGAKFPSARLCRGVPEMVGHLGSTLAPDGDGSLEWVVATSGVWGHLNDVARDMAMELLLPAMARVNPNATLADAHVTSMRNALLALGIRRLAKCVALHLAGAVHDARLGVAIRQGDAGDGWGEAALAAQAPNGRFLRFLGSQAELSAEGAIMNHCVGSYGDACARRDCGILSIGRWEAVGRRGRRWAPTSTAEVRVDTSGMPRLHQHYGPWNGHPGPEDREAAAWWLDEVRAGHVVLVPDAIRYLPNRTPSADELQFLLGAAWRTPDAHEHRWDRWRRLLGTRHRRFGDWLLSLPSAFMDANPRHVALCEFAVDMDQEMVIEREIIEAGMVAREFPAEHPVGPLSQARRP